MSFEVWKFEIAPFVGVCPLRMPKGAEILTVAAQANQPVLWALVDPFEGATEERMIVGWITGAPVEMSPPHDYLGTVLLDSGRFVVHLFELRHG